MPVIQRSTSATASRRALPRRLGVAGALLLMLVAVCIGSLPWTLGTGQDGSPRYNAGTSSQGRLPPSWAGGPREHKQRFLLGSDELGRSVLIRCLAGGGISLAVGMAAAMLSVVIGTLYGAAAGYAGGRTDAVMMRIVDVLYGLPTILLVVLLAVSGDSLTEEYVARTKERAGIVQRAAESEARARGLVSARSDAHSAAKSLLESDADLRATLEREAMEAAPPRRISGGTRTFLDLTTLLVAVGGLSWLTMSRVVRGQVLSLKTRPFVEAARAMGAPTRRIFFRHLLPNLAGPIIVYATLTVPQAILQEAFLSFLGIGVKPPMPSWGNLVAEGLPELNPYESNWWLLLFPCVLLAATLLLMNMVGESLRERFDPRAG